MLVLKCYMFDANMAIFLNCKHCLEHKGDANKHSVIFVLDTESALFCDV